MNVAIIVATCGDQHWHDLAQERAYPSALAEAQRASGSGCGHIHYGDLVSVAQARNEAAASICTYADWLCFLDADDELEPGYLDAMEHVLSLQRVIPSVVNPPLLVPKLRRVRANGVQTPPVIPNRGRWPRLNECVIGTLVRRDLFEAVGGFREATDDGTPIAMYEDWDLWLRCWNSGARLVYTDAVYREHVNDEGRNTNAHLSQATYNAIWADHVRDSRVLGR